MRSKKHCQEPLQTNRWELCILCVIQKLSYLFFFSFFSFFSFTRLSESLSGGAAVVVVVNGDGAAAAAAGVLEVGAREDDNFTADETVGAEGAVTFDEGVRVRAGELLVDDSAAIFSEI